MHSPLAGLSPRRRLAVIAVVACACLALGLGVLKAASIHKQPTSRAKAAPTSTGTATLRPAPTRAVASAYPVPDPPSPAPSATATPVPTATLPAFNGVAARPHLYQRAMSADLTLGGPQAPQPKNAKKLVYKPDPKYTAEDTLTDTGPGPPGPLSGLPTRPALANRRPVAVVIDNYDPDARPQAGLNRASVVFETVAEGGITRFMAIYLEKDAPIIGPVRSARIYFDSWAAGLNAIYGHAGGNNDALAEIPSLSPIANVDGLMSSGYWRSWDRAAPHNLYTSSTGVRAAAGESGAGDVPPYLLHKRPLPAKLRPAGGTLTIGFSGPEYNVQYKYDPKCNCYPRSMNGYPHVDSVSLRQIAPSNVVVLYAGVVPDRNSDTPGSVDVQTRGIGKALYFRDGKMLQGYWEKGAASDPLLLLDLKYQPVALNPGQTWFEAVPIGNGVYWTPQ